MILMLVNISFYTYIGELNLRDGVVNMSQKEAFEIVMNAINEKIEEVKLEIKFESDSRLKRRKAHELQSYENSLEHLEDVMADLKLT